MLRCRRASRRCRRGSRSISVTFTAIHLSDRSAGSRSTAAQPRSRWISDIKASGFDAQAIAGWNGPGPFTITNNYLEASTENVLFGGADPGIANLVPSYITFKGNHVAKPEAWRNAICCAGRRESDHPTWIESVLKGDYYYTIVATRRVALDTRVFSDASVPLTVTIPDMRKSVVTIAWNADPAATSYRVYRSTDRKKAGAAGAI